MTRVEAIEYVSFQMDDAHDRREATAGDVSPDDLLVGFHQGLEIVFVAVRASRPDQKLIGLATRPFEYL